MDKKDVHVLIISGTGWMSTWRFIISSVYFCICLVLYVCLYIFIFICICHTYKKMRTINNPIRCFGTRNLDYPTQAMRTWGSHKRFRHEDHIRDPRNFSSRQSTGCFTLPVSLIHVQKEVLAIAQRPLWWANKKSEAMRFFITISPNELKLMFIACRAKMILLSSARVNAKFLTVFSIYIIYDSHCWEHFSDYSYKQWVSSFR